MVSQLVSKYVSPLWNLISEQLHFLCWRTLELKQTFAALCWSIPYDPKKTMFEGLKNVKSNYLCCLSRQCVCLCVNSGPICSSCWIASGGVATISTSKPENWRKSGWNSLRWQCESPQNGKTQIQLQTTTEKKQQQRTGVACLFTAEWSGVSPRSC